jgi:hypothetical protein
MATKSKPGSTSAVSTSQTTSTSILGSKTDTVNSVPSVTKFALKNSVPLKPNVGGSAFDDNAEAERRRYEYSSFYH